MQATQSHYYFQGGGSAWCFTQRISKMMHNSLIDNSSDTLSMQTYLKRCILAEDIDKIQIATGYWDIPGMSLVIDELTSFINLLLTYCESGKIQIRFYTKNADNKEEFLHSKCYIFFGTSNSFGIIGSSNFTQKGLSGNSELNYLETDPVRITARPVPGSV